MKQPIFRLFAALSMSILASTVSAQIIFEKDGKWGLKDNISQKVILKPKYKSIAPFIGDCAVVENEAGKRGLIDRKGKTVIDCKFQDVMPHSRSDYPWVKVNNLWYAWGGLQPAGIGYQKLVVTPFAMYGFVDPDGWFEIRNDGATQISKSPDLTIKEIYPRLWQVGSKIFTSEGREMNNKFVSLKKLKTPGYVALKMRDYHYMDGNYQPVDTYVVLDSVNLEGIDKSRLRLVDDRLLEIVETSPKNKWEHNIITHCVVCKALDSDGRPLYGWVNDEGEIVTPFTEDKVKINLKYKKRKLILGGEDEYYEIEYDTFPCSTDSLLSRLGTHLGVDPDDGVVFKDKNELVIYRKIDESPIYNGSYDSFERVDGGWAICKNGETTMIADNGQPVKLVADGLYASMEKLGSSDYYIVSNKDDKFGLIDNKTGAVVLPVKYRKISAWGPGKDGEVTVTDVNDNLGYYDYYKKLWLLPLGSYSALFDREGKNKEIFIIEKNNKFGAYRNGKQLVPPKFSKYEGTGPTTIQFSNTNAYDTGMTYYIFSKDGRLLTSKFFYYDQVRPFWHWHKRQPQ